MFAYPRKLKRLPLPDEAVSLVEGNRANAGVAPEWAGGILTTGAIAVAGAAMVGLVVEAHDGATVFGVLDVRLGVGRRRR